MPNPPRPISCVLFDLDDTLNDRNSSWNEFVEILLKEFGCRLITRDVAEIYRAIVAADRRGYRPKDEFFGELSEKLPWINRPSAGELETFWRAQFAGCTVERPGARALLREIRSPGLRLGIVTNGRIEMQQAKVRKLGMESLVDIVIVSEAVGVKKPDARIYQEALRALSCGSEHTLFVGDNPALDVIGPAKLGVRTAWLKLDRDWPANLNIPDYVISSLTDLREIVELSNHS